MLWVAGCHVGVREGTVLDGRYRLLKRIGAGGMGAVWLAEKVASYERFAVKFLREHIVLDESSCARFAREVAVLRGLRHANIVDVFDWSLPPAGSRSPAYIVLEYLEGETLREVLKRDDRVPAVPLVRVMLQVLDGLAAVHAAGIVHRDLSPSNIFLVGGFRVVPRVKILDFGLAKAVGRRHADLSLTQPGAILGRAAYAAPEVFLDRELDVRADLFGCGMIMYRCLAGRFPYRESRAEEIWSERYEDRTRLDQYAPPSRFVPDVPPALEAVVVRAVRRRPEGRYETATAMQEELLRVDALLSPRLRPVADEPAVPVVPTSPSLGPTPLASLLAGEHVPRAGVSPPVAVAPRAQRGPGCARRGFVGSRRIPDDHPGRLAPPGSLGPRASGSTRP